MRINVTQSQIQYFKDHSHIEFEEVLHQKQVEAIRDLFLPKYHSLPFKQAFLELHDQYRLHAHLKKILMSSALSSIAASLVIKKKLRLAFDQMLFSAQANENIEDLPQMFHGTYNLHQISCISSLQCGVLINIDAIDPPANYPSEPGSALFFHPDYPIDFQELVLQPNQAFLLVAYASEKSQYINQPLDPSNHVLKKIGYTYGDTLKHEHHPQVIVN